MADVLDRLKNRNRATVAERDNSIILSTESTDTELSLKSTTPLAIDTNARSSIRLSIEDAHKELTELPEVADRRQIRLEVRLDLELEQLCKNQPKDKRITVETFLEAAYLLCKEDPELIMKVMELARKRLAQRKRAGNLRRALAQLEE